MGVRPVLPGSSGSASAKQPIGSQGLGDKTLLVSNSHMCFEVTEAQAGQLTFAGGCLLRTGHLHLCSWRQALHPVA